ncbi:MAG: hypothetical protein HY046_05320 [Acidobacteria bacterium]|nr:hypothetical protein [Acidobacteriota bacterium]
MTKPKRKVPTSAAKRLSSRPTIDWIPELAEPYLRGYTPRRATGSALHGYWFDAGQRLSERKRGVGAPLLLVPSSLKANQEHISKGGPVVGFFVGYLLSDRGWKFLTPFAPECMVFAYVLPVGCAAHKKLVTAEDAFVRQTFEYIRWLTHRPPRFQFFEREIPALIRHIPLSAWPARRIEHYSRNFFIEAFAWLVRSALVRCFAES